MNNSENNTVETKFKKPIIFVSILIPTILILSVGIKIETRLRVLAEGVVSVSLSYEI